ncbi:SH3 domain-containing protein [Anaplasmataceae bacterium AB001_6]|nr:SH3 domain-containing protein [Anaplasmataceae bacterium AB001_6]
MLFTIPFIDDFFCYDCPKDHFFKTKSNKINLRKGPSIEYPIIFTYNSKNIPVRILSCYEDWFYIQDYENRAGWIKKSFLIKNINYAIVSIDKASLFHKSDINSKKIYYCDVGTILSYKICQGEWCKVKINKNVTGWIQKSKIWGVE